LVIGSLIAPPVYIVSPRNSRVWKQLALKLFSFNTGGANFSGSGTEHSALGEIIEESDDKTVYEGNCPLGFKIPVRS